MPPAVRGAPFRPGHNGAHRYPNLRPSSTDFPVTAKHKLAGCGPVRHAAPTESLAMNGSSIAVGAAEGAPAFPRTNAASLSRVRSDNNVRWGSIRIDRKCSAEAGPGRRLLSVSV